MARDEQVIAFLDHRPVFKGHVLVAPTHHVDTLLTLPSNLMVPLLTMTQRIASRDQRSARRPRHFRGSQQRGQSVDPSPARPCGAENQGRRPTRLLLAEDPLRCGRDREVRGEIKKAIATERLVSTGRRAGCVALSIRPSPHGTKSEAIGRTTLVVGPGPACRADTRSVSAPRHHPPPRSPLRCGVLARVVGPGGFAAGDVSSSPCRTSRQPIQRRCPPCRRGRSHSADRSPPSLDHRLHSWHPGARWNRRWGTASR